MGFLRGTSGFRVWGFQEKFQSLGFGVLKGTSEFRVWDYKGNFRVQGLGGFRWGIDVAPIPNPLG